MRIAQTNKEIAVRILVIKRQIRLGLGGRTMAKQKFDGVVEAVRYKPNGEVDWVRVYERRGPTFTDYVIIDRQSLIERLKAGKKFMVGKRVRFNASTFDVSSPVKLISREGNDIVVAGGDQANNDRLDGVPLI